ncbi:MAG: pyridoxal phosphate enzyme (YggS family) [Paraglaciecola sp.]|jgi:pyridoxal phosphate enzyme (YggS family)
METIAERLKSAYETVKQSALAANRPPNSVQLLAVSKTKPVSDIVQAYEAGQLLFGENYVQEGIEKVKALVNLTEIEWHFIGPLQSNKTRLVAENFDWVQSVDRLKIAQRLNDQRSAHKKLNVCIQVNINDEVSKAGVKPEELEDFARQIRLLPNLTLRGLMAIPAAAQTDLQQHSSFQNLRQLFDIIKKGDSNIDTLSMGMSGDLQCAIANGATMVRLGTAIFGARK